MTGKTLLEHAQHREATEPDRLWLTQPMGGGAVKTFTWRQGVEEARRMAAHLRSLDLPPKSQIALFSKNSAWWLLADMAIAMAGHVTVPIYPTLTPDIIRYVIDHSEAKLVFVGKLDDYASMAPGIPDGMPRIELPLGPGSDAPKWADLVAATEPLAGRLERAPDDIATILYTSGSTANPKGVMIAFGTQVAAARAIVDLLGLAPSDRYLSYLPLAHALERWVVGAAGIVSGFEVYFAEALDTFVADLKRARPTLFVSVPRLWAKFQEGVFKKMPPKKLERFLKIPILRGIVRKKILRGLGLEHVRFAGSGSAPIPADLIAWYRRLGLELLEGYGMSENFNVSHVTRPGRVRVGYVGEPYPGVQQRLSEEGEIQVKSPGMMVGYFKNPEATAETFTPDGWLKTGDKGVIDELGRLKITGRIKEIFKTAKGKYVAPAPIENELQLAEAVESACVMGSGMPQPWAVLTLSERGRAQVATAPDLVVRAIDQHLEAVNKTLPAHEQLDFVVVVPEEWTTASGALTPTLKIKRRVLEERYNPQAETWAASKRRVVFA